MLWLEFAGKTVLETFIYILNKIIVKQTVAFNNWLLFYSIEKVSSNFWKAINRDKNNYIDYENIQLALSLARFHSNENRTDLIIKKNTKNTSSVSNREAS